MKHTIKLRTLIPSLWRYLHLLRTLTHILGYLNEYYGRIYFTKQMFEAIEQVAALERKTKKKVANELMKRGLRSYWGEIIEKYIEEDTVARVLEHNPEITLFVRAYNKLARAKCYDISKFTQ
jgi:hypothetical protein